MSRFGLVPILTVPYQREREAPSDDLHLRIRPPEIRIRASPAETPAPMQRPVLVVAPMSCNSVASVDISYGNANRITANGQKPIVCPGNLTTYASEQPFHSVPGMQGLTIEMTHNLSPSRQASNHPKKEISSSFGLSKRITYACLCCGWRSSLSKWTPNFPNKNEH